MSRDKSLFKKYLKGSPPKPAAPRSTQEINQEYTTVAQQIGAKTVEAESIKRQIQQLITKVDDLGREMSERTKLDAEAAKQAQVKETKEAIVDIANAEAR